MGIVSAILYFQNNFVCFTYFRIYNIVIVSILYHFISFIYNLYLYLYFYILFIWRCPVCVLTSHGPGSTLFTSVRPGSNIIDILPETIYIFQGNHAYFPRNHAYFPRNHAHFRRNHTFFLFLIWFYCVFMMILG